MLAGSGGNPPGSSSGAAAGGSSASGGSAAGGSAGSPGGGAGGSSSSGGAGAGGGNASGAGGTGGGTAGGASGGNAGSGGSAGSGGTSGTTPTTVWIAGDSTVQTCSSACPCGWGGEIDALFNDQVKVVNSAVGGRSIQTWLHEPAVTDQKSASGECVLSSQAYSSRWNAMLNAQTGMKAGDTLIIQFGINDGDSACPRHVGTALYKTYLVEMAKAAKERNARPIFVTPVSAIQCSGANAVGTRGFLTVTKEAGAENGVPVIDLHQLSVDLYNSLGLCPNDGNYTAGKVGQFFCEDHTHFEAAGAKQIAAVVAGALKAQALPLAAYLK